MNCSAGNEKERKGDINLLPRAESAAARPAVATPLAALLAGHVLRDGEVIILLLRPSMWYILLSGYLVNLPVVAGMLLACTIADSPRVKVAPFLAAGAFILGGRILWSVLQWMNKLYILTDLRIVALSGVFNVEINDCALRKVAHTDVLRPPSERILRLGTIEIVPHEDCSPPWHWQTIARPLEVHQQIVATIAKAKHAPGNGG